MAETVLIRQIRYLLGPLPSVSGSRVFCTAIACAGLAHASGRTIFASQELDEFFGVRHHSEHTDASNSRGDSQGEESGDLSFRKQESRPTDMDPILAHPVPTPSGRLTHVDSEGRASMVDIAKVGSPELQQPCPRR